MTSYNLSSGKEVQLINQFDETRWLSTREHAEEVIAAGDEDHEVKQAEETYKEVEVAEEEDKGEEDKQQRKQRKQRQSQPQLPPRLNKLRPTLLQLTK